MDAFGIVIRDANEQQSQKQKKAIGCPNLTEPSSAIRIVKIGFERLVGACWLFGNAKLLIRYNEE